MNALATWIFSLIVAMAPPARLSAAPGALETHQQAKARYAEIASAIATAVELEGPMFGGALPKHRTAGLVAVIWYLESGFRRDIDLGLNRVELARQGYNDHGRSWCMGQINLGKKLVPITDDSGETVGWRWDSASSVYGWTGRELVEDRVKCARATIRALRRSVSACRHLAYNKRLAAYMRGKCSSEEGQWISEVRMRIFRRKVKLPAQ